MYQPMLHDPIGESDKKTKQFFMNIRPYFGLSYFFLKLHYITLEAILKTIYEPFESDFGELLCGSLAVVHS